VLNLRLETRFQRAVLAHENWKLRVIPISETAVAQIHGHL
jgi:hypothetical protein